MRFRWIGTLLPLPVALLAAATLDSPSPVEDLLRRANAAFVAGDTAEADRLYAAAAELTTDPGLVAFNRAAVLYQLGDFREAEVLYARALADAECPPDRAAKAWYNRGTALLRRGGSAAVYRSAIACLERALELPHSDAPLRADCRYNLELAKLLWDEARRAEAKRDTPNRNPPPEDPDNDDPAPPPRRPENPESSPEPPERKKEPGGTSGPIPVPKDEANPMATTEPPPPGPREQPTPARSGPPPELEDRATLQPLSPEDTRRHLRDISARLRDDRRALLRTLYGPPQPGVNDW